MSRLHTVATGLKVRPESFGGIIASDDPPFLAFADRAYMRERGWEGGAAWERGADGVVDQLSAPVEVHLASTNRCQEGCAHCYMGAGSADPGELDTEGLKAALRALAGMGVFHVALGGGEALLRDDLVEIASYARELGLVPNLTTSGAGMTARLAADLRVFGQVNCSLDGIGPAARVFRPRADEAVVAAATAHLRAAGVSTGLNAVVGRDTVDHLEALVDWAVAHDLQEIELLRVKPAGRGLGPWREQKLTDAQHRAFYPQLTRLVETRPIRLKVDCSFVPMLCHHQPPREVLQALGVCGCEAGNYLLGARSDGRVSGCSFLPASDLRLVDLPERWADDEHLVRQRAWFRAMPEPCASCDYAAECKGGCRAVAAAVEGDPWQADPECPRVVDYRRREP